MDAVSLPRQSTKGFVISWVWVIAWAALIFVLSSSSELPKIPGDSGDKYAHAIVYAVLAALTARALASGAWRGVTWGYACLATILATLYGVSDEIHQAFVPGRHPSWGDVMADALGALVGAGLVWACAIIAATQRRARSEL
ncbi:MAG: teicoplanin resistance protein VanZ [Luteitalea sp.]|nr:teicoplanin resistance protein VanZ [Luteitalea sp.]